MTADAIRELLNAAPFVPFVIHFPDRPALFVNHPDFAMLSPSGGTMAIYRENDALSAIDVALITELQEQPPRITRKRSR